MVHTDHKPLTFIFSSSQLSPALQQWLDVLLNYSFKIYHRDGVLNVVPDQLSGMFGSAYAQSPVWGVNGSLPSAPIVTLTSSSAGEREATASSSNDTIQFSAASTSSNDTGSSAPASQHLLVELERRGKTCPATLEEKELLISKAHHLGHFGREAILRISGIRTIGGHP